MPSARKKILIVGLGNPGSKYEFTRHNLGFRVIERLRESLGFSGFDYDDKVNSEVTEGKNGNLDIVLARPQTFMNKSGDAVLALKKKFGVTPTKILVIHDDKDINLGEIKLKDKGSAAGHKGVASIIERIGSDNFKRVRLGIWNEQWSDIPSEKFVLSKFIPDEEPMVRNQIDRAVSAVVEELGIEL